MLLVAAQAFQPAMGTRLERLRFKHREGERGTRAPL